jgi:Tfp pilus assembly protein PilF
MKFQRLQAHILVVLLCSVASVSGLQAQTQTKGDATYHVKRQQAMQLFEQDKRLEALPLLEELAQQHPKDDEVLVALAASLVHHAATQTDQQAAATERFRAKNLLQQALDLGNNSPLAQNLHELFKGMPSNAAIQFSDKPAVEQAMVAGEAAFSRHDFAEALKNYAKAMELDPKNYAAVLFTGNTYHRQGDFAKAGEWYERAIQLDPNTETGYRYYAEMLVKEGEMAKARTMLIHAAVAEPYNRIVWRDLTAWAALNDTRINFEYAGLLSDPEPNSKKKEPLFEVNLFPKRPKGLSDAWREYQQVRGDWKERGKFKQRFPQESGYRHSLAEETEALTAEVRALETLRGDIETAEQVQEDQSLVLLLKLHEAGVLEPYVLFRLGDEGITQDYAAYREKHRDKLEEYMDKFVMPPAQAPGH